MHIQWDDRIQFRLTNKWIYEYHFFVRFVLIFGVRSWKWCDKSVAGEIYGISVEVVKKMVDGGKHLLEELSIPPMSTVNALPLPSLLCFNETNSSDLNFHPSEATICLHVRSIALRMENTVLSRLFSGCLRACECVCVCVNSSPGVCTALVEPGV